MTATASTPHPARRSIATLALVLGLGAMLVETVLAASGPATANHDIAWTLYAGGVLLDGGMFGRDLIDTNPPLIYWITALVVALSRALGVHPLQLWAAGTALWVGVGVLWLRRHLQRVLPDSCLPEALALATAVLLLSGTGFDVGQRDHLVVALLIPYLAVAVAQLAGQAPSRRERSAAALVAALGIALKPHHVLTWLAIEACVAGYCRRPRLLEPVLVVASGALYVACVLCLAPSYLQMIQMAAAVYGAYDQPIPFPWQQATVVLVVVALLRGRDLRRPLAAWAVIATLGSIAAAAAAAVQGKNYDYHYVPAQVLSWIALGFAAVGRLRARATSPRARARLDTSLLAAALAMALLWSGYNVRAIQIKTRHDNRPRAAAVLRLLAGDGPILVFTSSVFPIFPILNFSGLRSTSPYSMMWPIAGNYRLATQTSRSEFPYRPRAQRSVIERAFIDRIVEGMRETPPTLLLFDDARYKQGFGELAFDFERYFRADPRFDELMRGYERRDPLFDRYDLWLRADRAETPAQQLDRAKPDA